MDSDLTSYRAHEAAALSGAMPPRAPRAMPAQDLARAPDPTWPRRRAPAALVARRLFVFAGAALLATYGTLEMIAVVEVGGVTVLEALLVGLFAVTFGWIALTATTALAGLAMRQPVYAPPAPGALENGRTALVMPVYNEAAARTTAALQAMAEGLAQAGYAHAFEIVILSDSTDADCWVRESVAAGRLAANLADIMPVHYRHRSANTAKKAGNIKNFVENWGARYDYMVVLDADSVMDPATLACLVAAMDREADLGILQTVPILAGRASLFARLQQFAGRLYGPVVARGLAAWSGDDGNYWGHNAIIRIAAFAQACGLPDLPGHKPFGGAILSHDFVEAALIRRAGWRARMAVSLAGSWEESPPSLIDVAIRDRRWAQGNLQHAKVIGAARLAWPSRVHFAIGIMSYLSSPLWLMLLGTGLALSLQAFLFRPEYFSEDFQLFPTWPRFDSERMLALFVVTMTVLLLPKLIGLARALLDPAMRKACGGGICILAGGIVELILSALYAPILMLLQSRQIYEILSGRDSGWAAQRRGDANLPIADICAWHWKHSATGLLIGAAAWTISPPICAWLSPTLAGLVLAPLLSWASGERRIGQALAALNLLATPEERNPPDLLVRRDALERAAFELPQDGLVFLAESPDARAAHVASNMLTDATARGRPDPLKLTAAAKIAEAASRPEALAWLTTAERFRIAGDAGLLERLAALPVDH